jgi:adenylate cyclase
MPSKRKPTGVPRYTVPFSVSILTLMALIVLPLASALMFLGWRSVEVQEQRSVELRMDAFHDAVSGFLANSLRVVISAGETLAQGTAFSPSAGKERDGDRMRQLIALLRRHSALAAAFVGYPDGRTFYVERTSTFSARERAEFRVPDDGLLLMRVIDGEGEARREDWWFNTAVAPPGLVHSRPSTFDPRTRPWYVEATRRDEPILTDPYRFAWSNAIGISAGVPIERGGVIGFDLALGRLSSLMNDYKITPHSIVSVSTPTSNVSIESERCTRSKEGCRPEEDEVRSALRRMALQTNSETRIERSVEIGGRAYLLIAQGMTPLFGEALTVAAAVPEDELSAASHALLLRAAIAAAIAVVVAILAVMAVSLLLSHSMARLAAKADRIRQLDFTNHVPVRSRITEVLRLSRALERMNEGLEVFGLYVSKELVGEIMRAPSRTGLGGTRRQLTVMFTDIEGFSRISESIEPELLTDRLSRYFDTLGEAISAHRGMIDKYIGDSVMAFWNAPQPDPDHIYNACATALDAAAASRQLADKWIELGRAPFRTRIGLHTGMAVVGNVGARRRINYTLVGAVANQASRLEALNKIYGTEILASGDVATATADRFVWRSIDRIVAAGTTEALDIHEPLGGIEQADRQAPLLARWQIARAAYAEGRFVEASDAFQAVLALKPDDGPSRAFIRRCTDLAAVAPPPDWDGVWHFDRK